MTRQLIMKAVLHSISMNESNGVLLIEKKNLWTHVWLHFYMVFEFHQYFGDIKNILHQNVETYRFFFELEE